MVNKRQVIWTLGMSLAGLFLGLKGQDTAEDTLETALIVLWFASIGFGLGGVFAQNMRPARLIVYWVVTLGSLFPFVVLAIAAAFLPNWPRLPFVQQALVGVSGACIGALLGIGAGKLHLRRLQTNSGIS